MKTRQNRSNQTIQEFKINLFQNIYKLFIQLFTQSIYSTYSNYSIYLLLIYKIINLFTPIILPHQAQTRKRKNEEKKKKITLTQLIKFIQINLQIYLYNIVNYLFTNSFKSNYLYIKREKKHERRNIKGRRRTKYKHSIITIILPLSTCIQIYRENFKIFCFILCTKLGSKANKLAQCRHRPRYTQLEHGQQLQSRVTHIQGLEQQQQQLKGQQQQLRVELHQGLDMRRLRCLHVVHVQHLAELLSLIHI